MCGIVAVAGAADRTLERLVEGLDRLEYRGYDSAGVAVADDTLQVRKCAGPVAALADDLDGVPRSGAVGIGHTRWSTHGPPTVANAHPQCDCTGEVAVVHNGVVTNAEALRADLAAHRVGEIDTSVIPHLIEAERDGDPVAAVRAAAERLEGRSAFVVAMAGVDRLIGVRLGSPLVVGLGDGLSLASDVPAIEPFTDRVCHLRDGDVIELGAEDWQVTDLAGEPRERPVETVDWARGTTGRGEYAHYMRKEIDEQPRVLRQSLAGRLGGGLAVELGAPAAVRFVGAGTSYHAGMVAARRCRTAGLEATAEIASEFATDPPPLTDDLVVAITQSGETADTLAAVETAIAAGADTAAVVNTPGSTIARRVDHAIGVRAGPEVSVAATKTFVASVVTLELLVRDLTDASGDLGGLSDQVQSVLETSSARAVAGEIADSDAYVVLGRGLGVPVALEGALKTTEITYEHARGHPAGEFKHGPLAIATPATTAIGVIAGDECARRTAENLEAVAARGASIVAVTDGRVDVAADHRLAIPRAGPIGGVVLATVQLQLLAYHLADRLDRPIDRPRHLAKSVTVE